MIVALTTLHNARVLFESVAIVGIPTCVACLIHRRASKVGLFARPSSSRRRRGAETPAAAPISLRIERERRLIGPSTNQHRRSSLR